MRRGKFILSLLLLLFVSVCAGAQDLPRKIRGYSVYKADINLTQRSPNSSARLADAAVVLSEPVLKELSLTGVTLEISAEINACEQSGKVDFLAFSDLRVNGISVEVDEYRESFAFEKGEFVKLPKPASIFVPTTQLLRATLREMNESKKEWTITGRVFVFGKFRKYGFEHKRVVPIDINLKIANPVRSGPLS
ncbi:MAG: hypothetical protein ABI791_02145 [Acidobacteriota bacterium]